MSILAWIALGLVGGAVAGFVLGDRGRTLLASVVVATLGAILGGFMAAVLLGLDVSVLDASSMVVSAFGAALMLAILRLLPPADIFD